MLQAFGRCAFISLGTAQRGRIISWSSWSKMWQCHTYNPCVHTNALACGHGGRGRVSLGTQVRKQAQRTKAHANPNSEGELRLGRCNTSVVHQNDGSRKGYLKRSPRPDPRPPLKPAPHPTPRSSQAQRLKPGPKPGPARRQMNVDHMPNCPLPCAPCRMPCAEFERVLVPENNDTCPPPCPHHHVHHGDMPHRLVPFAPLVLTRHRAAKQGQSRGSIGTTSQGNGTE